MADPPISIRVVDIPPNSCGTETGAVVEEVMHHSSSVTEILEDAPNVERGKRVQSAVKSAVVEERVKQALKQ